MKNSYKGPLCSGAIFVGIILARCNESYVFNRRGIAPRARGQSQHWYSAGVRSPTVDQRCTMQGRGFVDIGERSE